MTLNFIGFADTDDIDNENGIPMWESDPITDQSESELVNTAQAAFPGLKVGVGGTPAGVPGFRLCISGTEQAFTDRNTPRLADLQF